jgi:Mn-dependent DtxR family transcriptional regulator
MTAVTAGVNRAPAGGTRTSADLGRRLGLSPRAVEDLLDESERAGLVERHADGWRLTARAERKFGPHLRGLRPE